MKQIIAFASLTNQADNRKFKTRKTIKKKFLSKTQQPDYVIFELVPRARTPSKQTGSFDIKNNWFSPP